LSTQSERYPSQATPQETIEDRLAAGPISWGVCEVPGWGIQLPADRVLAEMRSLGVRFVEAGPVGYLGADGASVRRLLDSHGLALVGGFHPAVLHDPSRLPQALESARAAAVLYSQAGGRVFVSACVVDERWSPRVSLDARGWRALVDGLERLDEIADEHGLVHVLHPHVGTLVETADDLNRILDASSALLCVDTGHLTIGGVDSAALAGRVPDRIAHVHLKDVRGEVAALLRQGRVSLAEGTRRGLFCPLGDGDAPVAETVRAVERAGYTGWYVLEQDTALTDDALPPPGTGPAEDARRSMAFLRSLIGRERSSTQKEAIA
jgi:inosose dehydratase